MRLRDIAVGGTGAPLTPWAHQKLFENKNYPSAFLNLGGKIFYESPVTDLIFQDNKVRGVYLGEDKIEADAVILASGGFEANDDLRKFFIG